MARRLEGKKALITGGDSGIGRAVAWAFGFLLYNWAAPLEVPAWTAAMSALFHDVLRLPFPADVPGLSATALGFTAAFVVAAMAAIRGARRPVLRAMS